jgi:hypothetical protein
MRSFFQSAKISATRLILLRKDRYFVHELLKRLEKRVSTARGKEMSLTDLMAVHGTLIELSQDRWVGRTDFQTWFSLALAAIFDEEMIY